MPTVLVVDDEPSALRIMQRTLEKNGWQVLVAANGLDALGFLTNGPNIHLLVSDVMMPKMDGLALTRAALERNPSLPVILVSGYCSLPPGFPESGKISFLQKPFLPAQLAERAKQVAGGSMNAAAPDEPMLKKHAPWIAVAPAC